MRLELEYDQDKQIASLKSEHGFISIPVVKGPQKFYIVLDSYSDHVVEFGVEYP